MKIACVMDQFQGISNKIDTPVIYKQIYSTFKAVTAFPQQAVTTKM